MRTTKFVLAAILLVSVTANPEDTDCTEGGQYLPSATDCSDVRSEATCSQIYRNSLVSPGAVNERPYQCFLGVDRRPDQDSKRMAVEYCPKTCGYCCLTKRDPAYNATTPTTTTTSTSTSTTTTTSMSTPTITDFDCTSGGRYLTTATDCSNSGGDRVCASLFPNSSVFPGAANERPFKCRAAKTFAVDICPRTCGYCCKTKNAGVPGGCVDKSPNCTKQFCVTIGMEDFVAKFCKRTCDLCYSRPTAGPPVKKTTPAAKINECEGLHDQPMCHIWRKNGFCNNPSYPVAERKKQCPFTCKFC